MLISERSQTFATKGYRFGFQGQEGDDEVSGEGNSYTAEFWQYDSRLGRRFNMDPRPMTDCSPYSCFTNNPITMSDSKGDTAVFHASTQAEVDKFISGMSDGFDASLITSLTENEDGSLTLKAWSAVNDDCDNSHIKLQGHLATVLHSDKNTHYRIRPDNPNGHQEIDETERYGGGQTKFEGEELTIWIAEKWFTDKWAGDRPRPKYGYYEHEAGYGDGAAYFLTAGSKTYAKLSNRYIPFGEMLAHETVHASRVINGQSLGNGRSEENATIKIMNGYRQDNKIAPRGPTLWDNAWFLNSGFLYQPLWIDEYDHPMTN